MSLTVPKGNLGQGSCSFVQMRKLRLKKDIALPKVKQLVNGRAKIKYTVPSNPLPFILNQTYFYTVPCCLFLYPLNRDHGRNTILTWLCRFVGGARPCQREIRENTGGYTHGPLAPPQAGCPPAQQARLGDSAASGGDARAVTHLPRRAEPGTLPAPGQK